MEGVDTGCIRDIADLLKLMVGMKDGIRTRKLP